jgi:hypothetical protein
MKLRGRIFGRSEIKVEQSEIEKIKKMEFFKQK